jgi:putative transposase
MTSSAATRDVGTDLQVGPERLVRADRPRLRGFSYEGQHGYHVVIVTRHRAQLFTDVKLGEWCLALLSATAARKGFELFAYCLMPDHLHILARGTTESSRLIEFVRIFKQRTAFEFKKQTGEQLWQDSYFDRVLRRDEHAEAVANYIFHNPVEAGLVSEGPDYRLSGGLAFDGRTADRPKGRSLREPPIPDGGGT